MAEFTIDKMLEDASEIASASTTYYGVTMHSIGILLPKGQGCEVVSNPVVAAIPNAPDYFLGLMTLRGDLFPVYSLAPFFAVPPVLSPYVMVFGQGDLRAAICCDALPQVLGGATLMPIRHADSLPEALKLVSAASYFHAGGYWFELHFEKLLSYLSEAHFLR